MKWMNSSMMNSSMMNSNMINSSMIKWTKIKLIINISMRKIMKCKIDYLYFIYFRLNFFIYFSIIYV